MGRAGLEPRGDGSQQFGPLAVVGQREGLGTEGPATGEAAETLDDRATLGAVGAVFLESEASGNGCDEGSRDEGRTGAGSFAIDRRVCAASPRPGNYQGACRKSISPKRPENQRVAHSSRLQVSAGGHGDIPRPHTDATIFAPPWKSSRNVVLPEPATTFRSVSAKHPPAVIGGECIATPLFDYRRSYSPLYRRFDGATIVVDEIAPRRVGRPAIGPLSRCLVRTYNEDRHTEGPVMSHSLSSMLGVGATLVLLAACDGPSDMIDPPEGGDVVRRLRVRGDPADAADGQSPSTTRASRSC